MRNIWVSSLESLLMIGTGIPTAVFGYSDAVNPLAPPIDQVNARFGVIESEISRLQQIGDFATAAAMSGNLQHFKDELAGAAPSNVPGPELDVIGVYTGQATNEPQPPGTVTVHLQASDRPFVLGLGGAVPTNWSLQLDAGVQLQKVILSPYSQVVLNPPPNVPVEEATNGPGWFGIDKDWALYPAVAQTLYAMTDLPLSSFQGSYNYSGQPFQIGPNNADWRAQRVLREMNGLYDQATAYHRAQQRNAASSLEFSTLLFDPSNFPFAPDAIATSITPLGKLHGPTIPLNPGLQKLTLDPASGKYYGLGYSDKVVEVDPATGQQTEISRAGTEVQDVDWLQGAAFDTKRNRLVIASLGSEGWFISYSPATQQWSTIASLEQVDLQGLTYRPADDCFYGLTLAGGGAIPGIYRYDANCAFLDELDLSAPLPASSGPYGGFQITMAGDSVAVLTPPRADLYRPELDPQSLIYLIDPDTGEVTYSETFSVPEPINGLPAIGCMVLAQRRKRRTRTPNAGA
jgi:hypothetical protein